MQTNVTVLGGLKITVEFCHLADDETKFEITHINGKRKTSVKWLYQRLEDKNETGKVIDACYDDYASSKYI